MNTKNLLLPKAVIFDTDNTLYDYATANLQANNAVVNKFINECDISKEEFLYALSIARESVKKQLGNTASSHNRLLYYQKTIELLGLKSQILLTLDLEQTYWRTFLSHCYLFDGVVEFIKLLKSRNIPIAVITDLTAQIQFRKLVYFNLDSYFDFIVTSEEVGVDKPNKLPFEQAFAKLDTTPQDTWMIGDSCYHDIKPARKLGMVAFQKIHKGVEKCRESDYHFLSYHALMKTIHNS